MGGRSAQPFSVLKQINGRRTDEGFPWFHTGRSQHSTSSELCLYGASRMPSSQAWIAVGALLLLQASQVSFVQFEDLQNHFEMMIYSLNNMYAAQFRCTR